MYDYSTSSKLAYQLAGKSRRSDHRAVIGQAELTILYDVIRALRNISIRGGFRH